MITFLKSMGGKNYYEVNATIENGTIKIAAEDMDNLLRQFPQELPTKTYHYVGDFAADPGYVKYEYGRQMQYKLQTPEQERSPVGELLFEDDGKTPKLTQYKQYHIRTQESQSLINSVYEWSLFPIPMRTAKVDVYAKKDSTVDRAHPVVSFSDDNVLIDFDLLENTLEFYVGPEEDHAYVRGDIYYNTEDKQFKTLIERNYDVVYEDLDNPTNPVLFKENTDYVQYLYERVDKNWFTNSDGEMEARLNKETGDYEFYTETTTPITGYSTGSLVPDGTRVTAYTIDNGAKVILNTTDVVYSYGAVRTLTIAIRDWVPFASSDTQDTFINKYTGTIWTKEVTHENNR